MLNVHAVFTDLRKNRGGMRSTALRHQQRQRQQFLRHGRMNRYCTGKGYQVYCCKYKTVHRRPSYDKTKNNALPKQKQKHAKRRTNGQKKTTYKHVKQAHDYDHSTHAGPSRPGLSTTVPSTRRKMARGGERGGRGVYADFQIAPRRYPTDQLFFLRHHRD